MEVNDELELTTLSGVGPATKQKLNDAGIYSILDLATAGPADIAESLDIDVMKAVELNNKARKKLVELGRLEPDFISASDLLERRKNIQRITTGSKNLDDLLGGGVETWAITEFYGEFGSGKCVAGDTKIVYANDEKLHLESIAAAYEKYRSMNGEFPLDEGFAVPLKTVNVIGYNLKPTSATYLYREKVRIILNIHTARGRELRITKAHKFLTLSEEGLAWKSASELKPFDNIATPKSINIRGSSTISPDDAYFIGLFVAEGTSNPLSITNSDPKLLEWLVTYLERRFGFIPTVRRDKRTDSTCSILLRKDVVPLLGRLTECDSYTKHVPDSILNGDQEIIRSFLAGYLEGDGSIDGGLISLSSNSKELIDGASYILSRLGISCTFSFKEIKTGPHYRLSISGFDRAKVAQLPFRSKKNPHYSIRNAKYGVPIGAFIRKTYKRAVSSTRWHLRSEGALDKSGTLYEILTRRAYERKGVSERLLQQVFDFFESKHSQARACLEELERVDLSNSIVFNRFAKSLPFDFSVLTSKIGLTRSGLNNYFKRGVAPKRVEAIKVAIRKELDERSELLWKAIATIKEASNFNWDAVRSVGEEVIDDYVYDFVVPDGHTFVGGSMPTIMHNTQICHTLCCMVQLSAEQDGLDGGAIYIDTEGTFRPERIEEISSTRGLDPEKTLRRIIVARAYNSAHQELIVKDLGRVIEANKVKLVIVDSAVAHYRAEFLGRGTLAERQQRLNRFMHQLLRTAEVYNVAVVVTNQVQAAPDSFYGDPTRATGGHVVAHTSTYRIYLRKGAKSRIARMMDSPYHAERDAIFMLNEKGIDDPSEETSRRK